MITEDYCSFELSKLLKEKGFDGLCYTYYPRGVKDKYNISMLADNHNKHSETSRPTLQMAMKWLREVHNIIIVIEPHSYNYMEEKTSSYDFSIWWGDNYDHPFTTNYPTYEETVEAALKYCLTKLI